MRLFIYIFALLSLTSCADVMLLGSSVGVVGSSNTYVKAYNTMDVLTIATTKKDIKKHAYDKIKKKKENQSVATFNQLEIITEQLIKLTELHQEVNLKLDQLTIQVELNQEQVELNQEQVNINQDQVKINQENLNARLVDLETNKLVAFYQQKYANLIAIHKKAKSYKSPRQLAVVLQNKLKKQKEVD
jgi:2C-methyl-D-erythritol 2,4-cyclodiphosphate synthase